MATYREQINALNARFAELEQVGDPTDEQLAELEGIPAQIEALAEKQARAAQAAEAMKAHRTEGKTIAVESPRAAISNPKARHENDPKAGFSTPREFLTAVMRGTDERLGRLRAAGDEGNTYQGERGGFLLPVGFAPNLLMTDGPGDPAAPYVQRIPMSTQVVEIAARVDKNHSTSVAGGVTVTRRPESVAATASRLEFEKIALKANALAGLSYASEELLNDSPQSFVAILERSFGEQFASKIMQERLFGTGVGEFEGIFNSPAKLVITKEAAQADNTVVFANIAKMRGQIYGYENAVWMANHAALPQLIQLKNGDLSTYQVSIREDIPDTLLGRPIYYSEHLPGLGAEGEVVLVNWREYLEGTLQPLESGESIHVRFDSFQRTFRVQIRNDGRGWWRSQMTPINGPNLSPFVVLGDRTS